MNIMKVYILYFISSYFMHILQTCPDWLVADSHPPWKSPSWVLRRLCPAERFPLRQPNRCRVESTRLDHHRVPWNNDSLTWVSRWWFQILFIFTPPTRFGMFGRMHPVFETLFLIKTHGTALVNASQPLARMTNQP